MPKHLTPLEERFWSHVDFDGPVSEYAPHLGNCWLWTAAPDSTGYGRFGIGSRARALRTYKLEEAHRVAFALWHGWWPPIATDHLCRVRACVRPSHLEAVTDRENLARAINVQREKTQCPAGHLYAGVNLYVTPSGGRRCRTCKRQRAA